MNTNNLSATRQVTSWNDFVDTVKNTAKLSAVVKEYTKVESIGNNRYKARCPLHSEKTPSFICDDSKGMFYCFGCHAGGDIFSFIQLKEGVSSFRQAAERIGEKFNIKPPERHAHSKEEEEQFQEMQFATESAARIFQEELRKPENQSAMEYMLTKRKLTPKAIEEFRIGFVGKSANLSGKLIQQGVKAKTLIQAGISRERNGSLLDFFYSRIIIPILDQRSKVIGFGARYINDNDATNGAPKYINSPDSPIFKKGETLFNFGRARLSVFAEKQNIMVVEGYMDVIAASIMGHNACVAPLGTSITHNQLSMILSIDSAPIICFNADNAGRKAAMRCAKTCLPLLKAGNIIKFTFPSGRNVKDLDDLRTSAINELDAKAKLSSLISRAQELQDFIFNNLTASINPQNPNEMATLEKEIKEVLSTIRDQNLASSYRAFFRSEINRLYRDIGNKSREERYGGWQAGRNSKWGQNPQRLTSGLAMKTSELLDPGTARLEKSSIYHAHGILYTAICFPYLFVGNIELAQESINNTSPGEIDRTNNINSSTDKNAAKLITLDEKESKKLVDEVQSCIEILGRMDEETEERISKIAEIARIEIESRKHQTLSSVINYYTSRLQEQGPKIPYSNKYLQACLGPYPSTNETMLKMLDRYADETYSSQVSFRQFIQNSATKPTTQIKHLVLLYTSAKIAEEITIINEKANQQGASKLLNDHIKQLHNELRKAKQELSQTPAEDE